MLAYRARVERRKTQYFGALQAKNTFMLVYRARVERHKSQCFGPPQAKNLEFMQSYFLGNNFFWSYFLEKYYFAQSYFQTLIISKSVSALFPDTHYFQNFVCVISRKHYFLTEFHENLEKRKIISTRALNKSRSCPELFPGRVIS